MTDDKSVALARDVLRIEGESILRLIDKVDHNFSRAVELIYRSSGRVIVTGIGKSGLIGKKIVATLTSTGTQAIFLHPVEGLHGDLGIVTRNDIMLAISHSGETDEVNVIVASIKQMGAPIIAFTGNPGSTLGEVSDVVVNVGVEREACPFGLAPTSSSTAALAMGDALAVALIERRQFNEDDFYKFHPGGSLGSRLRAKVKDFMISGPRVPRVYTGTDAIAAVTEMDEKNRGFVLVTDRAERLLGILTDGDLRRLVRKSVDMRNKRVDELMTRAPKSIEEDASLARAIERMQKDEITTLVVLDREGTLKGYIHLHDILGRGGTLKISINH